LSHASAPRADGLGRLFFTPQQRAQLELAQAQRSAAENRPAGALTLNGIVQRSDGARTVWINGVAHAANDSAEHAPASQRLSVNGKLQPDEIKVGQRLSPEQSAAR